MATWTTDDIPAQHGRTVVITGANGGLGAAATRALAQAGARVLLACRDLDKARAVADSLVGRTEVHHLDLADLSSIRAFAATAPDEIDVLINNAGVMAVPKRRTVDGFEQQIGINHLGHFALTGLLINRISDRVVTVSSGLHRAGRIRFDLNWQQGRYDRWRAYGQSKLANLLFAYELQRRLRAAGRTTLSVAAHPGYADTGLQGRTETFQDRISAITDKLFAQSPEMGALPILYAATAPDLPEGCFIGPDGPFEMRGYPKIVQSSKASHDTASAANLWNTSESLTGVTFDLSG